MSTVTLYPGGPPAGIDLGASGAVVTNIGAGSVDYSDTAEPFVAEGTIAATASVTLTGTQFFRATAGSTLSVVESDLDLGSTEELAAGIVSLRASLESVENAQVANATAITSEATSRGSADTALALRATNLEIRARAGTPLLAATRGNALMSYLGALSDGVITSGTSRLRYQAVRKCGSIVLRFANYYNLGTTDQLTPNAITVKASIEDAEYPGGTAKAVTFNGAASVVIAPGGWVDSDPLGVDFLTPGVYFSVRTYVSVAGGERFPRMIDSYLSRVEGHNYAVGGADLTTTYVALSSADSFVYGPVGVYAVGVDPATSGRAVARIGDSNMHGVGDGAAMFGWAARALGASVPNMNLGNAGDRAELLATLTTPKYRFVAMRGCSDAFLALGTNDVGVRTAAQTIADLTQIIARLVLRGMTVHVATIPPQSTSSDSWATVVNQTAGANMAKVTEINAAIRAGLPLAAGVLEISDAVSSARDSGKWSVYTVAGTITNGNNVISGLPAGHKLTVGSPVTGGTIPAGQTVSASTATTATYAPGFNAGATAAITVSSKTTNDGLHFNGTGHNLAAAAVPSDLLTALAA